MIQRGGINCPFANYLFTKVKVNSMCTPAGVSPPCLHSLWFWGLRQGWSQADELGSNPSLFNKAFWDLGFPEPVSRVTRKLFLGSHVAGTLAEPGDGLALLPQRRVTRWAGPTAAPHAGRTAQQGREGLRSLAHSSGSRQKGELTIISSS